MALDGSANIFLLGNSVVKGGISQKLKALLMALGRLLGITKKWQWAVKTALTSNILPFEVVPFLLHIPYTQLTDIREVPCKKSLS